MIKSLNYFLQAILIYLFFLISRIIGIKASRKIFSFIFCLVGPFFKSKNIIKNNIKTFSKNISDSQRDIIINEMFSKFVLKIKFSQCIYYKIILIFIILKNIHFVYLSLI